MLSFFESILKLPLSENLASLRETEGQVKTLLLIDDAHNLFLSSLGGYAGFETMLELIGQPARNLFWCLDFNQHAWNYLYNVYNRHQYFGRVLRLSPWSEQSLQQLILPTHNKTGFQISYDEIIQAAGNQNNFEHISYIENRFFSLLRQQSRGNPRLAIYLWLSALRQTGEKALQVGLPKEPETSVLATLSDDALFVMASIARHENLTLMQIVQVTQLKEGVVRYILDQAVRLKLLDCEDNRIYRLAILYQYPLISYLQAKHCLYE